GITRRKDVTRSLFEPPQRFFLGHTGSHTAIDANAVPLLVAAQRARCGRRLQLDERADAAHAAVVAADFHLPKLVTRDASGMEDLRDALDTASLVIEAVHVAAGEHDGEIAPD